MIVTNIVNAAVAPPKGALGITEEIRVQLLAPVLRRSGSTTEDDIMHIAQLDQLRRHTTSCLHETKV